MLLSMILAQIVILKIKKQEFIRIFFSEIGENANKNNKPVIIIQKKRSTAGAVLLV